MRRHVLSALVALSLVATPAVATAGTIGLQDQSFLAMSDAVVWSASLIAQAFAPVAGDRLDFTGTFNDTGFSVQMMGVYAGVSALLSISGVVSDNAGTFTSTGFVDGDDWTGSGSWSFIDVTPTLSLMGFDAEATIEDGIGYEKKPDQHAKKDQDGKPVRDVKIDLDSDKDNIVFRTGGIIVKTEDGKEIGEVFVEDDVHRVRKLRPKAAIESILHGESLLVAEADYEAGTIAGSVTTVPEPGTIALVGVGLAVVARRRFAARRSRVPSPPCPAKMEP